MTFLRLPRDNNNANGFCEIREYWSKDPIFFTNNFLKISIKCINYKNTYQHFQYTQVEEESHIGKFYIKKLTRQFSLSFTIFFNLKQMEKHIVARNCFDNVESILRRKMKRK